MTKKRSYEHIAIAPSIFSELKETVKMLNILPSENEFISVKGGKKKHTMDKISPLTYKTFTESALSFFIKNKIDPRFYEDTSLTKEMSKFRNSILGFIFKQENTLLKPIYTQLLEQQGLVQKDDLWVLKNKLEDGNIDQELAAIETQAILMGLLQVLFDMMEVSEPERKRLEQLLQKKGGEYIEKQTAS